MTATLERMTVISATSIKSSQKKWGGRLKSSSKELGGMLIESLVGLLILSLVGGGVMHATARMANTQQQQAMNNIAVNQMRSLLVNRAAADGTDLCTGQHKFKLPGQTEEVNFSINGCDKKDITISKIKINTSEISTKVNSMRPVVLEFGTGDNLIRVGGKEVQAIANN